MIKPEFEGALRRSQHLRTTFRSRDTSVNVSRTVRAYSSNPRANSPHLPSTYASTAIVLDGPAARSNRCAPILRVFGLKHIF